MKKRFARYDDYIDVVDMYYKLIKSVYHDRKIAPMMYFFKQVYDWFHSKNCHIRVYERNDEVIAFSLACLESVNGLTETVYNAEITWIEPEHRKSGVAYSMYNDVYNYGVENGYKLTTSVIPEAESNISKRWDSKKIFTIYQSQGGSNG